MADEVGKPRNDGAEPRGLHGPGDTAEPDELAVDPGVADPTVELPDEERDEKAADEPQPAREAFSSDAVLSVKIAAERSSASWPSSIRLSTGTLTLRFRT